MSRTTFSVSIGFALIVGRTPAAIAQAPPTGPVDVPVTPSADVIRSARLDPQFPLRIGSDFYPPESVKHHEEGTCQVAILVADDGGVPALQLLKSSGFPRLDAACAVSVLDRKMLPATRNGQALTRWSAFPISWVLKSDPKHLIHPARLGEFDAPRVAEDYEFQVGDAFYPPEARTRHEEGFCFVQTLVTAEGIATKTELVRSTHVPALDHACVEAVDHARFIPERENGQPAAAETLFAIFWKLK